MKMITQMAWRNLWRQKRRTTLVMTSAAAGILGMIMYMGFLNGLKSMMIEGSIESGLGFVQIRPDDYIEKRQSGLTLPNADQIIKSLQTLQKSSSLTFHFSERTEKEGMVRLGGTMRGVNFLGINPETEKNVSSFDRWLVEGEYLKENKSQDQNSFRMIPIMMGKALARKFEVEVADFVIISMGSDNGNVSYKTQIVGVYEAISDGIDLSTVLLLRSDLLSILKLPDNQHSPEYITLSTENLGDTEHLKTLISETLSSVQNIKAATYKELQPEIVRLLEFSDQFKSIFYLIIMTGFALTLLNSILMSVLERTREIGILRAIGTRGKAISLTLIFESVLTGMLGCAAGVFFGGLLILWLHHSGLSLVAFARGMEMMGKAGSVLYPWLSAFDIFICFFITLSVSFIAVLYPVRSALKLTPIKAIYDR
ncbi:MAG: ABC transporter permease [Leptospiraceae bacterium]|nr:ABC transporter permease [Leptospiraceae bacterium]